MKLRTALLDRDNELVERALGDVVDAVGVAVVGDVAVNGVLDHDLLTGNSRYCLCHSDLSGLRAGFL